jgi:type I restriction enzyme S subunit
MAANSRATATIEELIASGAIVAHKDGNYGSNYPRVEEFGNVGVPFLTATSLRDGYVDITRAPRLADARADELPFGFVQTDDVLLSHNATIGRVAVVPQHKGRLLVGTSLTYFRVNPQKLLPRYLAVYLAGRDFQNQLAAVMSHSTRNQVPVTAQRKLHVVFPPLVEQQAIAAVLGALDDKIELNRRTNATLEAMARALFQSWFVDFDPVRAKLDGRRPLGLDPATAALFPSEFEDSELGHIPRGWTAGKLGDVGTNSRRGVHPSEIAPDTPYIALEHMPRRSIALGDWDESADVASGKSAFKKGEILFGKLRPYFHKVGVAPFDGVCSTDILVLAPKNPEWFGFLLGHASSDELVNFTDLASTGTKMPRTNWSDISAFKMAIPPKTIADSFTQLIQRMVERIIANLFESRTLAGLRDTLLPKLLSGELSAPELTP